MIFPCLKGAYKKDRERLYSRAYKGNTKANSFKLRVGLNWEEFLVVGVVRRWNKLPREAVDASLWDVFKARLDRALSNLV